MKEMNCNISDPLLHISGSYSAEQIVLDVYDFFTKEPKNQFSPYESKDFDSHTKLFVSYYHEHVTVL